MIRPSVVNGGPVEYNVTCHTLHAVYKRNTCADRKGEDPDARRNRGRKEWKGGEGAGGS